MGGFLVVVGNLAPSPFSKMAAIQKNDINAIIIMLQKYRKKVI